MTSNATAEQIKTMMRPEFLNRIDEIITFEQLTKDDIRQILHLQMNILRDKLADSGVKISFSEDFENYMTNEGYDPAYGARPIKRLMQRELINIIAKKILEGKVTKGSELTVDVKNGEVVVE